MGTISLTLPADGENADAGDVNTPLNTLIDEFNGNIENANIKSTAAIAFSKLASDAWTSYTPTWTNLTIGNGTTSGAYQKIGRIVHYYGIITWGSTTSSSDVFRASLPVTAKTTTEKGSIHILDSSTGIFYVGICHKPATTTLEFYANNTTQALAGNYATPFTWTTSDSLSWSITYESAS